MSEDRKPSKTSNSGDYEVGYGKPPAHTRFRPGQSGNPRGRPRGTRNLKTDLLDELDETILVREGEGGARQVSKQRAVIKSLVTRTLKGDARTAGLLLSLMMRLLDTGEGAAELDERLDEEEREILRTFEERLARRKAAAPPEDSPEEPS